MNLQHNKTLISCCFLSLLALAGCGLKGELYQTPESAKGEGFVPDETKKPTEKTNKLKKEVESEKSDTQIPVKSEIN